MSTLPTFHFANLNYLAVLGAAVASMVIGFLWYSPTLFSKLWKELSGMSQTDLEGAKPKGLWKTYLAAFLSQLVMAFVLAVFINTFSFFPTWSDGVLLGFAAWLGFVATTTLGMILWEKRPFQLYLLNNVHTLLTLMVMGAILAAWR